MFCVIFQWSRKCKLRGVILYRTFLYFFSIFIILLSSICTGFKPPTTSKFCCALIITVSIGCDIFSFLFLPSLFTKKLCIFLSFILGLSPFMYASWNFKLFLSFLQYKISKSCLHPIILSLFQLFCQKNNWKSHILKVSC